MYQNRGTANVAIRFFCVSKHWCSVVWSDTGPPWMVALFVVLAVGVRVLVGVAVGTVVAVWVAVGL